MGPLVFHFKPGTTISLQDDKDHNGVPDFFDELESTVKDVELLKNLKKDTGRPMGVTVKPGSQRNADGGLDLNVLLEVQGLAGLLDPDTIVMALNKDEQLKQNIQGLVSVSRGIFCRYHLLSYTCVHGLCNADPNTLSAGRQCNCQSPFGGLTCKDVPKPPEPKPPEQNDTPLWVSIAFLIAGLLASFV